MRIFSCPVTFPIQKHRLGSIRAQLAANKAWITRFLEGSHSVAEERGGSVQLLNPQHIRFSQASMKATFRDGTSIDALAEELRSGHIRPHDVPALRVFERGGKLFTLDNRRLEAFRRAGVHVPVRMATPQEMAEEAWKFTTHNDGVSIRIRGA